MILDKVLHNDTIEELINLGFYDRDAKITPLGSGTSRTAYGYKNYVFKIPDNLSGVAQNQEEFSIYNQVGNAGGLLTDIRDTVSMKMKLGDGSFVLIGDAIIVAERVEPLDDGDRRDDDIQMELFSFITKLSKHTTFKKYINEDYLNGLDINDVFYEYESLIESLFNEEYPDCGIRPDEMCLDFNMGRRENGDFVILDYGGSSADSFGNSDNLHDFYSSEELVCETLNMSEVPDIEFCA